ncbi:MAG: hypothetical protein L3J34_10305 [Flavobacteriaceae bacterium]|nr:hypothetical protein [Flavobacteriaceae bacterium]
MSDKVAQISGVKTNWRAIIPLLRYVSGIGLIMAVSTLWNYDLAYLTAVLGIGYIAPGAKPLTFKQGLNFIFTLIIITGVILIFSAYYLDYPLVFMPLLLLALLWIYYTDKIVGIVKIFLLMSIIVIPFVSIDSAVIGRYIAINLTTNALMAIILTQFIFLIFPWSEADEKFIKTKQAGAKQSEMDRFNYALNIVIILIPVLLLFYFFKLTSSVLILIFIAILSMSPALANPKVGLVLVVANVLGGIVAIVGYKLLSTIPNFTFMILLVLSVGLLFGNRIFSSHKLSQVFASGLSAFLLILGSVLSSDAEAGEKVWPRVIQIVLAVIYVVIAFRILSVFNNFKKEKAL